MTRALDLFAGAGGWDIACSALGIAVDGVENMPAALATREAAGLSTVHDDVWTAPANLGEGYEGLIASPPCQTFSQAVRGAGGHKALLNVLGAVHRGDWRSVADLRRLADDVGDERTALVLFPLHFATTYPYRWLAWEQVSQVRPVWEACALVLRALGWRVWVGNVQAEAYGVPQTRRRAVLLASRTSPVGQPVPTHSRYHSRSPERLDPGKPRWASMAEGLGWGSDREAVAAQVLARVNDQTGSAYDASWPCDRPCTTITSRNLVQHPGSVANRHQPGVTKSRNDGIKITTAEAAMLQTFPRDFPWQGSQARQFLQVGNAVPPGLARALLEEVTTQRPVHKWHRWGDTLPLFDLATDPTEGVTA